MKRLIVIGQAVDNRGQFFYPQFRHSSAGQLITGRKLFKRLN